MNLHTVKADGTPRAKRPTKEECEKRKHILKERYAEGESKEDLIAFCKQTWNLEATTACDLLRKITEDIGTVSAEDRTILKGEIIHSLHYLYKKALAEEDYRLALAVQKELCDISGIKKEEDTAVQRVIYLDRNDLRLVQ